MSDLSRENQRNMRRRAAQQPRRELDGTRSLSNGGAGEAGRAVASTRRRADLNVPEVRRQTRRTSGQPRSIAQRSAETQQPSRSAQGASSQQTRRLGSQPRHRATQGSPVGAGANAGTGATRGSLSSSQTTQIPRQRRAETAGQGAGQKRPARRNAAGVGGVASADQQRPSRSAAEVGRQRPSRRTADQPANRHTRSTGARSDRRAARQTAQASSSKHSVVAETSDGFSIENIAPEHRENVARWREWTTRGFAAIMALGLVIGLLFFARPATSEVEKRTLTPFPTFSIEGVLDGSFFSGVSTWYADTYPLREPLVAVDQWLESLFGIQTDTMMIGGSTASDDIPDSEQSGGSDAASADAAAKKQVEAPEVEAMAEEIQDSIMDGLYVKDGAAYSRYYFVQESAETYASALNLAADRLDGTTKVYSILIPNNSGALLSEDELAQLGGADQGKAIDYFDSLYSDKVTPIETYDTLRSHRSEYLYFRTDHHWTALGAYYVYRNFCSAIGKTPTELGDHQSVTFDGFLGSFYTQLSLDSMAANPDYVTAYYPLGTNDMTYWNDDGEEVEHHVITDVSEWAENSKYSTFVAGDQSLSVIENPTITDGSSCVFVKDSYGCAFAPFLVDNYQTVYIIDFRYYSGNIVDFCQEHNINDLVFLNNITMATATSVGEAILSEVQ